MDANAITRQERGLRQVRALLTGCQLASWYPVIVQLLDRYQGLEQIVDDARHAPLASVLRLLRGMSRMSAKPSHEGFAALLAGLEFLDYRVRRSTDTRRPRFERGETWDPAQSDLHAFAAGRPLGAWRTISSADRCRQTAAMLLRQYRHRHEQSD